MCVCVRVCYTTLRACSVDSLMYVKEDLIIPQHYSFYDFIINKARGKSGPLFSFDVHDDVRLVTDATVEKDEVGMYIIMGKGMVCNYDVTYWGISLVVMAYNNTLPHLIL